MKIMSRARIVVGVACLTVTAVPALAQVQRGVILGIVHDPSGAVLPGAIVQLTSEVGAPRDVAAGGRGEYRFQDLDPGRYEAARLAAIRRQRIIIRLVRFLPIVLVVVVVIGAVSVPRCHYLVPAVVLQCQQ